MLVDEGVDPDDRVSTADTPDKELEDRLAEEELLELIRRVLDPEEQQAIWLRGFEMMPVDEITKVLAITEASGARGVLQRARRKLRVAIAEDDS